MKLQDAFDLIYYEIEMTDHDSNMKEILASKLAYIEERI